MEVRSVADERSKGGVKVITHAIPRGFWNGCRCLPCRAAINEYNKGRIKARREGRQGYVLAERTMKHLLKFDNLYAVRDVLGYRQSTYLRFIAIGKQKRVRLETEAKILAIDPATIKQQRLAFMSDGVRVPYGPTKRRLRLLRNEGFTLKRIARETKVSLAVFVPRKQNVTARTEMRVEQFYNRVMKEAAA